MMPVTIRGMVIGQLFMVYVRALLLNLLGAAFLTAEGVGYPECRQHWLTCRGTT